MQPSVFACLDQCCLHGVAQLDQDLDVEGRVVQPLVGQRATGPVGGAVTLDQSEAEEVFDHGGQVDPGDTREPAGQFGVVERGAPEVQLAQAR